MATWYPRTWTSGKIAWYTKIKDARGAWKPLLLRGAKTEKQAKTLALELEKERERAGHGLPAATPFVGTFSELCAWANDVHFSKGAGAQPDASRLKTHAGDPEKGTATWLGALPLRQVTGPKFAEYFSELTGSLSARGKPYSPGAINRIRAQFASVFELAREHGRWFGDNPVHATKEKAHVKAGFDILQAHEIGPTLEACDEYWRGCLATGIFAALRKGELFGLQKKDVDLERRTLLVRRSHGRETTKGGTHKPVPIHEDLVPFLEPWLDTPGPWLFPGHDGKRRSQHTDLPRIVQMAMVRAGFVDHYEYCCRRSGCGFRDTLPTEERRECPGCSYRLLATPRARNIRWHEATRHTLASHALMSGAGVASVQAILRHADPRLTIQTYGHLSADFLGEEVNRVSLPGLARRGHGVPPGANSAQNTGSRAHATHSASKGRGAWVVRGAPEGSRREAEEVTIQHENRDESEWSRGVSNPGPMHCEGKGVQSATAVPRGTASQVVGFAHTEPEATSTASHPIAPRYPARGAPVVRKRGVTHHAEKTASPSGSGRKRAPDVTPALGVTAGPGNGALTADLLTVQQVADRLAVGRTWVRRRLEAGELTGIRLAPQAPLMVDRRELDAYLARFPGLVLKEHPEAPVAPVARSRKGAA